MIGVPERNRIRNEPDRYEYRYLKKQADYNMNVPPAERRQELADTLPSEQTTCTSP
jgi:hypothetical protein